MNNEGQGARRNEGTQYQRTIHRQILEENKTETVQEKFLLLLFGSVFKEGIVQAQRQVRMPHTVSVCSVSHGGCGTALGTLPCSVS